MKLKILAVFAVLACICSSAKAQVSASQQFTVRVPQHISIAPPADTLITHDETDADQTFPNQQWGVKANVQNGVTVVFSTAQVFTHTVDATYKRDVTLNLAIAATQRPGTWTIGQATDTTDYAGADEVALVQASSNRPGRATFDLGVTFITDLYGTFLAGDYVTTVTGTVTAN